MLNEENIVTVIVPGAILAGYIGLVIGSRALDRAEEKKSGRGVHREHKTHYERLQARLALSSGVIR